MSLPLPQRYQTWPPDWPEIRKSLEKCLQCGDWGRYQSPFHDQLIGALGEQFCGSPVHLCSSGTAAIELALRAAGVSNGDEVILASFDYPGNFRSIELIGGVPVLIDTAPDVPTMNFDQISEVASDRTRAVIVSHLYGHQAPLSEIAQTTRRHGWVLIEDVCQAIGMTQNGVIAGQVGDLAALSFGGSKLVTAGSGGAIIANNKRLSAKLSGILQRPSHAFPLSSLQCAALVPQLQRLDELAAIRNANACFLVESLEETCTRWRFLAAPNIPSIDGCPVYYKLALMTDSAAERDEVVRLGQQMGLPIGSGFRSMHRASSKRCRRATSLEHSVALGDGIVVIDHRMLMIQECERSDLVSDFRKLYRELYR